MSDPFATLIPDARRFLSDLSANNTRDWFVAHKSDYDTNLKKPAELLLEQLRPTLSDLAGGPVKPKLFRAHRDVRFSKDKTPYHTHLHLLWAMEDGPGWFLGISPDYVSAGAGVMGLAKDQLTRYRAAIDGAAGKELADALAALDARMDEPELKRVPSPYAKDHPHADLLRRKSLTVWRDDAGAALVKDMPATLMQIFTDMRPVTDWLRAHL